MSEPFVEVDLHGMMQDEARDVIERVLYHIDSGTYHVRLIHGFNRGTVLKKMILKEFKGHPMVKRIMPGNNQGITVLVIRELA